MLEAKLNSKLHRNLVRRCSKNFGCPLPEDLSFELAFEGELHVSYFLFFNTKSCLSGIPSSHDLGELEKFGPQLYGAMYPKDGGVSTKEKTNGDGKTGTDPVRLGPHLGMEMEMDMEPSFNPLSLYSLGSHGYYWATLFSPYEGSWLALDTQLMLPAPCTMHYRHPCTPLLIPFSEPNQSLLIWLTTHLGLPLDYHPRITHTFISFSGTL